MSAWWKPTAEGYFRHIAKSAITGSGQPVRSAHIAHLSKLKKTDIATEAERLAGWHPRLDARRVPDREHHTEPEGVPESTDEADAPEDAAEVGRRARWPREAIA